MIDNQDAQKMACINYMKQYHKGYQAISFEWAVNTLMTTHTSQGIELRKQLKQKQDFNLKYNALSNWRKILIKWLSKGII